MNSWHAVGKCSVKMIKLTDAFSCCKVVKLLPSMLTFLIVLSENLNCVSVFFLFSSAVDFAQSDLRFLRRLQGT